MQKTQNLQDAFLNYIRREKIPVTLFLMNGFQLRGVVRSFDSFVVLIDADGMTLGRLATQAAMILRGKNKPQYTPNTDTGDFVVVINADKVQLTGVKADHKEYWRYSGWLGGLKKESFKEAMEKHPERVVEHAIKGMLPHTSLGRQQATKLKVYAGPEHPHAAQNPVKIDLEA